MVEVSQITIRLAETGHKMAFMGRDAWTLNALIEAAGTGITPIERPAPRWSEYVRRLRLAGLEIETIDEPHGGAFPGYHGRYVLRTRLEVVKKAEA
jgi:hypothetical protein